MYEGIKYQQILREKRVDGTSPIKQIEFFIRKTNNILTVYINYILLINILI